MEFELDRALIDEIVSRELSQAKSEIETLGPLQAYRASLKRMDARLAAAKDAHTLACRAGCAWCCHFSVDVRPVEVLNLLEYMRQHLSDAEQARIRDEVVRNAATLAALDEEARAMRNIKCPFLVDNKCCAYEARPQTCRNYHATDAAGCEASFNDPENLDIDPEFAPLVYQSGGAHVDAFAKALADAGFDSDAYELNTALRQALVEPDLAAAQFAARKRMFPELKGNEVPLEFLDAPV